MPQMAPMNWVILFMTTLILYLIFNWLNYNYGFNTLTPLLKKGESVVFGKQVNKNSKVIWKW